MIAAWGRALLGVVAVLAGVTLAAAGATRDHGGGLVVGGICLIVAAILDAEETGRKTGRAEVLEAWRVANEEAAVRDRERLAEEIAAERNLRDLRREYEDGIRDLARRLREP